MLVREKFRSQIEQVCSRRTAINSGKKNPGNEKRDRGERKKEGKRPGAEFLLSEKGNFLIRDFAIARVDFLRLSSSIF